MEQFWWTKKMFDYEQLLKDQLSIIDMSLRNKENRALLDQFKKNATEINKQTVGAKRSATAILNINKKEVVSEDDLEDEDEVYVDISDRGRVVYDPKK